MLTSVSITARVCKESSIFPLRFVNCQPCLGVEVIYPKVLESGSRSKGPKLPIPIDSNLTLNALA